VKSAIDRSNETLQVARMNMKVTRQQYRAVRLHLNYTQAELAAKLGITRVTVSKRETGSEPITCEASMALRYELVAQLGEFSLPEVPTLEEQSERMIKANDIARGNGWIPADTPARAEAYITLGLFPSSFPSHLHPFSLSSPSSKKPDEEDEEKMHLQECVESGRQTLAKLGVVV
jgi:DNA-binding XRE family transcriptional regulator